MQTMTLPVAGPLASHGDFRARVMATCAALRDWDLSRVAAYCVQEGIYTPDEIGDVKNEYARFIALATTFGRENWVPISKHLDHFWHTHILFTEDYAAMCDTVSGRFIHHRPRILDSAVMLDQSFSAQTLNYYREYFGEPDMRYWDGAMCTCQIAD